jgi:hypothetical protein
MPSAYPSATPTVAEPSLQERQRRDQLDLLASAGQRPVAELSEMSDAERCKWLFWNLHENLDEIRPLEPTLQARVTSMQFTVVDGFTLAGGRLPEKRLDLACKWTLELSYPGYPDAITHSIGDGWINLVLADEPPAYLTLAHGQRAYLDADHNTYPNQIYLEGWVTDAVWQEMRQHLTNPNPTCRTDVVLLDNVLFPVKSGFDFVLGPPAAIGVMNLEFRAFSHPTERRMSRRGEPRRRG